MFRLITALLLSAIICLPQQIIVFKKKQAPPPSGASYVTSVAFEDITESPSITSPAFNVATGQFILLIVFGNAVPIITASCNGQPATILSLPLVVSNYYGRVAYVANANSGTGITCTANYDGSSTYRRIEVAVFSGIGTSSPYDVGACNSAGCNSLTAASPDRTTVNVVTTVANSVHIAYFLNWDNPGDYTGVNNYNKAYEYDSTTTSSILFRNVSSTGTYPNAIIATANSDQYLGFYLVFALQ